jgi:hypothetical protein
MLRRPADESELRQVIDATYQQLLNRVPLENQRMLVAESKLRDGQIDLDEFVEAVALGEDFQERLYCMAPLRAATRSPDIGLLRAAACFEAELHEHRLQLDHQRGRRSPLSQPWRTRPDQGFRQRRPAPSSRRPGSEREP